MPPGWGVSPEIEARLMIAPAFPRAIIPGATRLTRRNADVRLISTILSSCSSVASSAGPFWRLVALLLTRMSIGPSARSASRPARSSSSRFPTWQASGSTRPGRSASSPAVFSSTSSFRLAMATSAPAAASRAAMAFPMPRPPPVTRATRWLRSGGPLMENSRVGTERRKDAMTQRTVVGLPPCVFASLRLCVFLCPMTVSAYTSFTRAEWARLREATPLTLSLADLAELQGLNEQLSLAEVEEVYLPLSRLLNLHVAATRELERVTDRFLGKTVAPSPYILGVAGSVAVGKSTTSRVLRALLARWPDHPRVDLVTTDGFLYPNKILEERGLMARKGFPESYDLRRLVRFVADLKAGAAEVSAPVYSHLVYDILPGEAQVIRRPDLLILEGLNVLEGGDRRPEDEGRPFVSDYFDFSIYVDAAEAHIMAWFLARFRRLRG